MDNEKTVKKFEEPELQIIHLTETDVITTSGLRDDEGEMVRPSGWY